MSGIESVIKWKNHYTSLGYQAVPSRTDVKRPMVRFGDYWDKPFPQGTFEQFPTTNLQIMLGRHWGLLVIDLDGTEAIEHFRYLGRSPRTWVTHSGGGGGEHWWYTISRSGPPIPRADLWRTDADRPRKKGDSAIERLCERSLIVAPPSIHPKTGVKYQFRSPSESPIARGLTRPAPAPHWILSLPPLATPKKITARTPVATMPLGERRGSATATPSRDLVIHAIDDKVALARSWGLRIASERPSGSGWISVHSVTREDRTPSASFHVESGTYLDFVTRESLSLFDLGVALNQFIDWREAVFVLGSVYLTPSLGTALRI